MGASFVSSYPSLGCGRCGRAPGPDVGARLAPGPDVGARLAPGPDVGANARPDRTGPDQLRTGRAR